jgi:hypothetical protein
LLSKRVRNRSERDAYIYCDPLTRIWLDHASVLLESHIVIAITSISDVVNGIANTLPSQEELSPSCLSSCREREMDRCFLCDLHLTSDPPSRQWRLEHCDRCMGIAKQENSSPYTRTMVYNYQSKRISCNGCMNEGIEVPSTCYVCGAETNGFHRLKVEIPCNQKAVFIACSSICMNVVMINIKLERMGYCPSCETRYPCSIRLYINRWVDQRKSHPWLIWLGICSPIFQDTYVVEFNKGLTNNIGIE